jgi:tetratricopeptide (TPR) repeat protein
VADWQTRIDAASTVIVPARDKEDFAGALRDPRLRPAIADKGVTWASPELESLLFAAGFCAIEDERFDEAKADFLALLALNPLDEKAGRELAHVYVSTRRWDDGLKLVDAQLGLVRSDCARAVLWRKRGFILFEQLQLHEARAAYIKSLEYDPQSELARSEIRLIDQKTGVTRPLPPAQPARGHATSQVIGTGGPLSKDTPGEMPPAVPPSQMVRTRCEEH